MTRAEIKDLVTKDLKEEHKVSDRVYYLGEMIRLYNRMAQEEARVSTKLSNRDLSELSNIIHIAIEDLIKNRRFIPIPQPSDTEELIFEIYKEELMNFDPRREIFQISLTRLQLEALIYAATITMGEDFQPTGLKEALDELHNY